MRARALRLAALGAALLLLGGCLALALPARHGGTVRLSARFSRTVGFYPGSQVRILGIPVGKVTKITPDGTDVLVRLAVDRAYPVPAGAHAVIVSPSLVADRYVQLTPVYRGGPRLGDGAEIPLDRTAIPVELDRVLAALDRLDVALGPQGANADGALSRLLATAARNLAGNGGQLHQTVGDVAQAASTLAGSSGALFATVRNLQALVTTLAGDDRQVRDFNQRLASVAAQLAGERLELGAALQDLAVALAEVSSFVHDNAGRLSTSLRGLAGVSGILVRQQQALREVLDVAPTALGNLRNAYNPASGTLDTRMDVEQLQDPGLFLCSLLRSVGQHADCRTLRAALAKLPPLPPGDGAADKTLGGILGGGG